MNVKTGTGNTSKAASKMGSPELKLFSISPENTRSAIGLSVDNSGWLGRSLPPSMARVCRCDNKACQTSLMIFFSEK